MKQGSKEQGMKYFEGHLQTSAIIHGSMCQASDKEIPSLYQVLIWISWQEGRDEKSHSFHARRLQLNVLACFHQKTFFTITCLTKKTFFSQKKTFFITSFYHQQLCSPKTENVKTQKLKLWPSPNCEKTKKSSCNTTPNIDFLQNSKTQIVKKLKNSNCEKTLKLK